MAVDGDEAVHWIGSYLTSRYTVPPVLREGDIPMADSQLQELAGVLRKHEAQILQEWLRLQEQNLSMRNNLLKSGELEQQCREFLTALGRALQSARDTDV